MHILAEPVQALCEQLVTDRQEASLPGGAAAASLWVLCTSTSDVRPYMASLDAVLLTELVVHCTSAASVPRFQGALLLPPQSRQSCSF